MTEAETDHKNVGALFWVSAVIGWAIIAIGLRGIFMHDIETRPESLARFVVGGALIHDLLVAPLVIILAWSLARVVRGPARAVVQAALLVTAAVALFSYPLIRAYGLAANNPTSLPRNYALSLTIVLGIVWAVAAGVVLVRLRRAA